MKVTPIEIRQKDFNKVFRGYDKEEVDAFLKSLSQEWEKLLDENREVKKRLELAEREVNRLREVESSLFKTIKNAEDTGANLIDHAQRQADLHMREAQMNAEAIMSEARTRARKMVEEAEHEAKTLVGSLEDDVVLLQKEYKEIEFKKENAIREIQALGESLLDRVQREKNKAGREAIEERIGHVLEAAKSISTDVKKDFTAHELKTTITPITPVIDPDAPKQTEATLFPTHTIPPAYEPQPKPAEKKEPAAQNSLFDADVKKEEEKKTSPEAKKDKDNSGSFFDTI
ncbi:MAG: DivIVA domain-containing protein [Cytophaga sp.]|uniref:DivIVA domain-containing protein n=1 Tax=Cytophaga sp. TaxID=29535 RepID=UPI003F7E9718